MAARDGENLDSVPLEDESAVMAVAKEMARTVAEQVVDAATKPRKFIKVSSRVPMIISQCCSKIPCNDR
jgi:hypothetical protein